MDTTSVKISISAKESLDSMVDDRGIGKIELVSRAMEWLSIQDKTLQSVILGQIDPVDSLEVLNLIRRRLKAEMAEVSPAAQIVDDVVNAVRVQKKKTDRRVQPKEA